jgi:hypothetical protein
LIQVTDVVAQQRGVHIIHSVRQTDTLLPPNVTRLELGFPSGTRIHPARFPRCGMARLQAKGPAGCPSRARIGSGSIVGRTGLHPGGVGARVAIVKGEAIDSRPTVLLYIRPQLGPSFVSFGFLPRGQGSSTRIDLRFPPPIRTLAGGYPDPSLSDFSLRFNRDFLSAPCRSIYRVTSHFSPPAGTLTSSDRARCGT